MYNVAQQKLTSGGRLQVAGSRSLFSEETCHMQPATCHETGIFFDEGP